MVDLGGFLGAAGVGSAIGQAVVQLELDTKKYQAELAAAEGKTVAGTKSMSSGLAAFGGVAKAGMAAAGVAVVAFGAHAISAASDLGEAVNKSNVIFGGNAKAIEDWAETGAAAFGLSKTASLDAAAGFGAMLDTAGIATDELDDMSISMVELAGDMASFNNIDPTEALEKLRSGLAGEAEPLRRFGVFLSEAAVQQEAYASGIAKVGEELTEAQKIQARYNIIFEQTTKQQGDFARTADSLPNQLRTMRAEFENVSAQVGEVLLPIVTDLLGVFKDLLQAIGPLLELIGKAGPAIGFLADAFLLLVSPLRTVIELLTKLPEIMPEFLTGSDRIEEGLKALAEQSTEAGLAMAEKLQPAVEDFIPFLFRTGEAADAAGKDVRKFAHMSGDELEEFQSTAEESFDSVIFDLDNMAHKADVTRREFIRAHEAMEDRARELSRAMRELRGERWVNDDYIKFLSEQGPEWIIGFTKLTKEQQREAQEAWRDSEKATDNAKGSLDKIIKALDDMAGTTTKHRVEIHYEYVGYDPSKPGMGQQR